MKKQSIFSGGFTSEEPVRDYKELAAGEHHVRIQRIEMVTDRISNLNNKDRKDVDLPWSDETDQMAVVFRAVDNSGGIVHRFNGAGFKRFDELKNKKGFISAGEEGYAVSEKTGKRVIDPERTQKCANIVNDLFDAACTVERDEDGDITEVTPLPVGSTPNDLVGCELTITVFEKTYGESTSMRMKSPKRISVGTQVPAEEEDDNF